mgnify:CR=1 FL=1
MTEENKPQEPFVIHPDTVYTLNWRKTQIKLTGSQLQQFHAMNRREKNQWIKNIDKRFLTYKK